MVQMCNHLLKAIQNFEEASMPNGYMSTTIFLKHILLNELLRNNRLVEVNTCF